MTSPKLDEPIEVEKRYKILESKLQDLYNRSNTSLRISASDFTTLKNNATAKGIMYPSVNNVNQLPQVMTEDEMVTFIESTLIPKLNSKETSEFDYDYRALVTSLPYFSSEEALPVLKIKDGREKKAINKYVQELTSYNYIKVPQIELKVMEILDLMIRNRAELFSLETYRSLVKLYSMRYQFDRVMEIFGLMDKNEMSGDIQSYNIAIYESMKTGNKYRLRQAAYFCRELNERSKLDLLTVNAIAAGLKNEKDMLKMVSLMDAYRLPYYFSKTFFSRIGIRYSRSLGLEEQLDPERFSRHELMCIVNLWLKDEVEAEREDYDIVKLYQEFDLYVRKNLLQPTRRSFDLLLGYLIKREQNFPYAVAFYHFFQTKYGSGLSDLPNELNEWEVFGWLIETLIHSGSLNDPEKSPNWDKTVRYVYMKSIDPASGQSTVRLEVVESLNLVALKRKIFGFNLNNRLTLMEVEELERQLKKLRWTKTMPTWGFEDNHLAFRQASYYFGWVHKPAADSRLIGTVSSIKSIESIESVDSVGSVGFIGSKKASSYEINKRQKEMKQELRRSKHKRRGAQAIKGKVPKSVMKLINKSDSEGLIDNGPYDIWITNLYATSQKEKRNA
ncbi:hypothetical protein FOA43_003806 [Brettanomyces nanus]|uniref:Uncharacterized protein n=1 Tax=Eeniella nana TaxID=13502 RepID=A0A875RWP6_EENNA|nr:uncharacterized protein FOA43_003806 [Brettanomyces nanus]QPG76417.1 hypothetical protein FOA43_003806 [Brettanomyces nanus]